MKQSVLFCIEFSLLAALLFLTERANAATTRWPQWRGPDAQGVSEATGLPQIWSASQNIKWKADLKGSGDGSPCVWDDRLFLAVAIAQGDEIKPGDPAHPCPTGANANFTFMRYQFRTLCFARLTGKIVWEQVAPFDNPTQSTVLLKTTYANATPATDGEIVCVYFGMRWLLCYSIHGTLTWRHQFSDQTTSWVGADGDSPIISGDRIIVVREGSTGSSIFAFDKNSGSILWQVNRDEDEVSYASPVILELGNRKQISINATRKIRSYDYDTGKLIWECAGMTKGVIPTLAFGHGMGFAASSAASATLKAIKLGRPGDLTGTDAVVWIATKGIPHITTPLLYGNELYAITDSGMITCFDACTGKVHFDRQRLPGISSVVASPVAAEGKIFALGENGKMVILRAGPKFEVLASNQIPEKFHASPALVDQMIFLRGENHLFCISSN